MEAELAAGLEQLTPVLGPVFGVAVVMFAVWDYMITPAAASTTLLVRLLLVLAGAPAYFRTSIRWSLRQRCAVIYWTHAGAIVISAYLLEGGLLYGLAGITACIFTVAVITLRVRAFLQIVSVPSVLFVSLSALALPPFAFINNLMLYVFALGLAIVLMQAIRFFRQRSYLLEQELARLSRYDGLTGACNRRFLTEMAEREMALARRNQRPLTAVMLDVDHFKRVNDNYGHAVGDTVLRALSECCIAGLREIDHFGRIGGEEFVCVLPDTDEDEAVRCVERLRLAIEAQVIDTPQGPLVVTASFGVASLDEGHPDWSCLLKAADHALYCAKHEGRNRVSRATATTTAR